MESCFKRENVVILSKEHNSIKPAKIENSLKRKLFSILSNSALAVFSVFKMVQNCLLVYDKMLN